MMPEQKSSVGLTTEVLGLPKAYGRFDRIELERLGTPDAVEPLIYEAIRTEMIEALGAPYKTLPLSDPMIKLIDVAAGRELILRQRVNDSVRASMLAFANNKDLEHLAALYGVERRVLVEADPMASPPIEAVLENDTDLRARTQLAPEGFSVAGPQGAYVFYGMEADARVKDLTAVGPEVHGEPGHVKIYVLAHSHSGEIGQDQAGQQKNNHEFLHEDGRAPEELLQNVETYLRQDHVRPLTDFVEVFAADIIGYEVRARLYTYPGPDPVTVLQKAEAALKAFVTKHQKLGHDITDSGLKSALHQVGCQRVEIDSPSSDLIMDYHQAPYCIGIELSHGGVAV